MCTLKITFRVAAEYCRQQFIKTRVCQPDTVTIEVDTTAISENYRDLLIHFAPFAFSGDRVKLDIFVNGTTFEDLVTALAGTVIEDAKRKSQTDEKRGINYGGTSPEKAQTPKTYLFTGALICTRKPP